MKKILHDLKFLLSSPNSNRTKILLCLHLLQVSFSAREKQIQNLIQEHREKDAVEIYRETNECLIFLVKEIYRPHRDLLLQVTNNEIQQELDDAEENLSTLETFDFDELLIMIEILGVVKSIEEDPATLSSPSSSREELSSQKLSLEKQKALCSSDRCLH